MTIQSIKLLLTIYKKEAKGFGKEDEMRRKEEVQIGKKGEIEISKRFRGQSRGH
jgi:hypothetical protein